MNKEPKTCTQCAFACKSGKVCKNFKYGINTYQVCFYDTFGGELATCFDEKFYDYNIPSQAAAALSYVGTPGVRVFVNYYGGKSKELIMVDVDRREASYLDGTNDLNRHNKGYKEKHDKILCDIKKSKEKKF